MGVENRKGARNIVEDEGPPWMGSHRAAIMLTTALIKSSLEKCVLRWRRKESSVLDEWTESGREFQTVGAAARKEKEPKIRLVRG